MEFGEVLSRAWQIIWKYKVLWIFGILAGCGTATSGAGTNSGFRFSRSTQMPSFINRWFQPGQDGRTWLIIGIIILVIIFLVILALILGTIGRVGLIRGTQLADQNKEHLVLSELFNESMRYFWRILGLNLLVGIALAVIYGILIIAYVGISIVTLFIGAICLLPFLCLLVPLSWFIQVVLEEANVALVVEDTGIMDALQRGWAVVKTNLGPIILMALILILGVGLIGGAIIGLPIGVIVLPALGGVLMGGQSALRGGVLIAGLCFVAYLPVLLILSGILRAYTSAAWTLTYLRLTRPAVRLAEPLPVIPAPPVSPQSPVEPPSI